MLKNYRGKMYANTLARRYGSGGGFDPTSYGTLALWLDAADVTGTGTNPSDGSAVTTWVNKGGIGSSATNFGDPTLSATGVNGKPGIFLNGFSMGFRGTVANTGAVSTTFAVATLSNAAGNYARLVSMAGNTGADFDSGSYCIPFLRDLTSPQNLSGYRGNAVLSTKSTPAYDTPFYATSVFDLTNNTVYVNGVAGSVVANAGPFAITKYGVGIQPNQDGDYWRGYVSEVLIYNSALSTTNRQAVEAYLATKWVI